MSNRLRKIEYDKIANQRNHEIVEFEDYQNVKSKIGVHCLTCDHVWYPTGKSYKNAKKLVVRIVKNFQLQNNIKTKLLVKKQEKIG